MLKDDAIRGYGRYRILPSLTIAQAILETGWGGSSLGNNIFGIKANSSWKGKKQLARTHEYVNGKKIYINAWFREYDSIYESLEDRYKFLQGARYSKVVGENDYKIACREIQRAEYATDESYSTKLIGIIEQNNLQEIDKIAIDLSKPIIPQVVSKWAREPWAWTTKEDLLDGNRPLSPMTRQEFSVLLRRMVD